MRVYGSTMKIVEGLLVTMSSTPMAVAQRSLTCEQQAPPPQSIGPFNVRIQSTVDTPLSEDTTFAEMRKRRALTLKTAEASHMLCRHT